MTRWKTRRRVRCPLLMLVLFTPLISQAQPAYESSASTSLADSIRHIIDSVATQQRVVGLRTAVLYQGKLIYAESYGVADIEHEVPVTEETRFFVASIAKTFTGAAILKLVEEGLIDQDAPIQDYVPSFPGKPGPDITPRLLLAHRAGIRRYRPEELSTWDLYSRHFEDATDALAVFKDDDLVAPPGTRQYYTSFGYNLLAAAVEGVTGIPFKEYLRETFFEPLNLDKTLVPDARLPVPHRSRSYHFTNPETRVEGDILYRARELDFSYNYGGGNLLSTAEDLVRYGHSFRQPGLLAQPSLDLIYGRTEEIDKAASMGWSVVDDSTQGRVIHATGASEAFLAGLTVWIDHDLVVAIVSNTWGIGARSGELNYQVPFRIGALLLTER